jgi:hypothetical protein
VGTNSENRGSAALAQPATQANYIATADFLNLIDLADFEMIRQEQRQLLPRRLFGLGPLVNRYIAPLPGIRQLCLRTYIVGRPVRQFPDRKLSASILIPCRNEKGNIENAIRRMPKFGSSQEIPFVEGNSSDGTFEECERVRDAYKDSWNIKVLKQDGKGKGKGDAVRKRFAAATGDVLHRDKQAGRHKIDMQHRSVILPCAPVAIDAGPEGEEPVHGARVETRVSDENKIACGIEREPCGKQFARREMQIDRNQRDLLCDPQPKLKEIGSPPSKKPLRTVGAHCNSRLLASATALDSSNFATSRR